MEKDILGMVEVDDSGSVSTYIDESGSAMASATGLLEESTVSELIQ